MLFNSVILLICETLLNMCAAKVCGPQNSNVTYKHIILISFVFFYICTHLLCKEKINHRKPK